MMDLTKLSAEFPKPSVHWRVQGKPYERNGKWSAMALAYLDARDVMDRLDEVCGPANWQDEYVETAKGRVICRIGVRTEDGWVWKSDGAGNTDVEGEKGGISDALKRAAVHWGIGRYLYRLDSPWVECEVGQKNNVAFWKKWVGDPWAKVRVVGYAETTLVPEADEVPVAAQAKAPLSQQAAAPAPRQEGTSVHTMLNALRTGEASPTEQPKPKTLKQVVQGMFAAIEGATTHDALHGVLADAGFRADLARVREKAPDTARELDEAADLKSVELGAPSDTFARSFGPEGAMPGAFQ